MCREVGIKMRVVAANDHEGNGVVEPGNRILRNFFRKVRSTDKISSVSEILSAATFGKNTNKGAKLASSFELMYVRKPPILNSLKYESPVITIEQHVQQRSKLRLQKMLNSAVHRLPDIRSDDFVLFWRDGSRWLSPAIVVPVDVNFVTINHDGILRTSSLTRVMRVQPPLPQTLSEDELDDELKELNEADTILSSDGQEPNSTESKKSNDSNISELQKSASKEGVITRLKSKAMKKDFHGLQSHQP